MYLPYKARKQFRSKITKQANFKVTKSKYVTNNFCFHDEFEKLDTVCFLIFLPDRTRKGKNHILQYIEGVYYEMQASSFPVQ